MSIQLPDTASNDASDAMRAALARRLDRELPDGAACPPPSIPDHTLLQRIGRGAYGEVWLARNTLGTLRAVKIVHRARFEDERPFEREFNGILKYEPVSRTHEGLVQVLHVGRNDAAGCFYYVMELADPAPAAGGGYAPRTLRSDLARHQRLPPADAAQFVLRLAGALAHLHAQGLVHRDLKPSNIIFVGGQPKLADIGLVTGIGSSHSFVGTEGFVPPEGPGTIQADLFSLGKLLYELATGLDRLEFPQLPPGIGGMPEGDALLELNEVMTSACAPDPRQRYARALALQADLNLFLAGRSLRRARHLERHLHRVKQFATVASLLLLLTGGALWLSKREARLARDRVRTEAHLRQRAEAAEHAAQRQLYTALLEQARATVRSGELGQRVRALEALRQAAAISNSVELRREVVAALALPDLRFERTLRQGAQVTLARLDPAFERIALCRRSGPVEIRSVADDRLLATLPASTNLAAHVAQWSRDGRYLAVKRDHDAAGQTADWEVWEPATAKRLLWVHEASWDAAAFHPHQPHFLVGLRSGAIVRWDLLSGREIARHPMAGSPVRLVFSPDGRRFATTQPAGTGWELSVHDSSNAAPLAARMFPDFVSGLDWHPDGRWIAVSDYGTSVHLVDAASGDVRTLGRHKAEAAQVLFSPDGRYLFSGGWEREIVCWDVVGLQRALAVSLGGFSLQVRVDGGAYAVATPGGLQVHAFDAPAAHRRLAEDLGARLRHATFSPDGRWLAASAEKRMGVWDLARPGPPALKDEAREAHLFFTADAEELFASRSRQGEIDAFRWRLSPALSAAGPPRLERLPLHKPRQFTFLCLHSNSVVMTGAQGSQVLAGDELQIGKDRWTQTAPGISGVSPDGRWLGIYRPYSASLYVYRLPELERIAKLAHPGNISAIAFSPLGDEVAVAFRGGIDFWSVSTWERTRALTNFSRILYAPDARSWWLAQDWRTAGLYDAATLNPRLLLPPGLLPLALSSDGRRLAVSVGARRLQVWDLVELRERFRELGLDWADGNEGGFASSVTTEGVKSRTEEARSRERTSARERTQAWTEL